ncbi:unnamed protein product [Schistocephalus solidus]|uniref:Pectin acetylesterase n=1 Tax=Schistocephalus solidus TaxID=70667 RepID=A0A183T4A8_SCHSO|nr:unnamed protein product [Schistocephalus solidus]
MPAPNRTPSANSSATSSNDSFNHHWPLKRPSNSSLTNGCKPRDTLQFTDALIWLPRDAIPSFASTDFDRVVFYNCNWDLGTQEKACPLRIPPQGTSSRLSFTPHAYRKLIPRAC